MYKPAILAGALFALLAVVLGAFGAHALKAILPPETLQSFETGVRYQMYHAIALILVGIIGQREGFKPQRITTLFNMGIVLFSFSIYALTLLKSTQQIGLGKLGILTPIGGLFLIAAWGMLAWQALRAPSTSATQ
jgi:uncharacterized membrane protein YgdD (TMEM256/DUF423 family)